MQLLRSCASLAFVLLAACQVDDIVVEVFEKEGALEFAFHYEGSQKPVELTTMLIRQSTTGRIVWDLKTYNPSEMFEKQGDKSVLKKTTDMPPINSVAVSRVAFGRVPEGFTQYCPSQGQVPTLERDQKYEIFVLGRGHRGRTEFTIER